MNINIHNSWRKKLINEFEQPYFRNLEAFVKNEYSSTTCCPPVDLIFSAFDLCHFDDVKVVIIGQDPYPDPKHAHGLAFSSLDATIPESLKIIYSCFYCFSISNGI